MKRIVLLLIFFSILSTAFTQIPVGKWRTHFSYAQVRSVKDTGSKVFGLSSGSLFYVDKADLSIHLFNKEQGLNDSDISLIDYSDNQLIVIYRNGNIDIVTSSGIFNIPELKNKVMEHDKVVNHLFCVQSNTYLSTSFGIVVLNNKKFEIKESYILGTNCLSSAILNDTLYVAQENRLIKGSTNSNLLDQQNWFEDNTKQFHQLAVFNNQLFGITRDGKLYSKKNQQWSYLSQFPEYQTMRVSKETILITSNKKLYLINTDGNISQYETDLLYDASTLDDQNIWIAQDSKGINLIKKNKSNNFAYQEELLMPQGPSTNHAFQLKSVADKIYCLGGGRWANRYNRPALLSYFENEQWHNLKLDTLKSTTGLAKDFINLATHPDDKEHYYISSWGDGLFEFKGDQFIKLYNSELQNTSIETIFPGEAHAGAYNRIDGPAFDKDNNLFVTNTQVKNAIQVLKKDGSWVSLYFAALKDKETIGSIYINEKGLKWVVVPRPLSQQGLFVFDTKSSIDDQTDDESRWFSTFYDQDGKIISPNVFYCIAEDKNGTMWLGTDLGPILLNNTHRIFDSSYTCYRPKLSRNDGSGLADYLLNNIAINTIAIDGGNRKWVGSLNNGIYLVDKDNQNVLLHFTKENSPLPSNTIHSIAIHPQTGEVFIGTDTGIVSFRGDATEVSQTYNQVHSFPNPVRPGYEGPVTITGLRDQSHIKIMNISNKLIYEGSASGGQFVWNQTDIHGKLVSSGIYIVYISNTKEKDGTITKIMVIR